MSTPPDSPPEGWSNERTSTQAEEFPWSNPPEPKEPKAERARQQLRSRPGVWALLAEYEGLRLGPWWLPLFSDDEFETYVERVDARVAGKRRIYAKYIGE